MRTRDEKKVKAIRDAVIELSQADGFTNLTTAKVAKKAGVSPATIYWYYTDKTDLLSRLYEAVKNELHSGLTAEIKKSGTDLTAQLIAMLTFTIIQAKKFPKESHFVSALWTNQELLDEQARKFGEQETASLLILYKKIQADSDFIDAPQAVLSAFCSVPSLLLQTVDDANEEEINQTIQLVVKTLKK
ncbi:TetR/AcrR family transcriptional regulator [Lactiplantibacillus sp. WILCCON 0030]|uniref:TetR/AcrR family transcriptional regulator n=1 Tax=Lactiplantibacillus brownii TaxID=3069269 RepID=A0ABU1A962_9LACO|nr:TetR/AcrR family transcriptional regulator [Lactiplantibacillus brownii]MDQ7937393.1 TetR/AcrR family transcriptional regulator [Lactiplantibacillus brownii]